MEDDPCPPDHYWDPEKGKCVPLGKSVPTREQLYDPEGPYNQWLDELNYRRNKKAYRHSLPSKPGNGHRQTQDLNIIGKCARF